MPTKTSVRVKTSQATKLATYFVAVVAIAGVSVIGGVLLAQQGLLVTLPCRIGDTSPRCQIQYEVECDAARGGNCNTPSACPANTTACPPGNGATSCCAGNEICKTESVPVLGSVSYCTATSCPAPEVLHTIGGASICCQPGDVLAKVCVKGTPPFGVPCLVWAPVCGDTTGRCPADTKSCGDVEGAKVCCPKNTTTCNDDHNNYPLCVPKPTGCAADETHCLGTGNFDDTASCCAAGKTCGNHPDGKPLCY